MNRRDIHDVAVIGGGIVGSVAAIALARQGLRVVLVEAEAPPAWQPQTADLRVYAIAADSRSLLEKLGAWTPVASARVQPYRRMRVWDAAGGDELCFDADQLGREALGYIVEHALLADRLWTEVGREASVEVRCPARLHEIESHGDGVILGLAGGERVRARLAIGADGASSRLRELAGIASDARDYGQRGLVAYVETTRSHEDTCWQRFLPGGPLAFLPCTDGRSSIVWTLPEVEAERLLQVEDQAFRDELTRAIDGRLGEVRAVSDRRAFPLRRNLARGMLHGRIALLGDAAHVVHPLAGQGLNLGFRDVSALADLVASSRASGRDWLAPHRLERWARSRTSENAVAAHAFEAINGLFSNDAMLPTLLRGPLLGIAGRLPPLSQFLWKRASGA